MIFLIRDPRDVFVSYYFQRTKRKISLKKKLNIDWENISIGEMLHHKIFGIKRIIEFMNLWYSHQHISKRVHLMQYEKLRNNPQKEFEKLLDFIEEKVINFSALNRAIEETTFEKMQKNEYDNLHSNAELSSPNPNDPESFKTRKGEIGGYRDYLNLSEMEFINKEMENLHPDLKISF